MSRFGDATDSSLDITCENCWEKVESGRRSAWLGRRWARRIDVRVLMAICRDAVVSTVGSLV